MNVSILWCLDFVFVFWVLFICLSLLKLQPDISKYCADVLPLLLEHIVHPSERAKERNSNVTRIYYALETFCENLGADLYFLIASVIILFTSTLLCRHHLRFSSSKVQAWKCVSYLFCEGFVGSEFLLHGKCKSEIR